MAPDVFGSYKVVGLLGEGGMGVVYVAIHVLLGKRVAVKVLHPELSSNQEHVQRFFNEAKAATVINHPGIVEVFDFGFASDGSAYLIMELLEGESLGKRLRTERLALPVIADIVHQLASALGAAHDKGIIHRDLKPDNVFLVPHPGLSRGLLVKLLDFGIAKLKGGAQNGALATRAGMILGTPAYMAPEQCRGVPDIGPSADIYALGCMLFEMLCGRQPFVHEHYGDLLTAHIQTPPPDPRTIEPWIPEPVAAAVLHLLAKDPAARPASMKEVSALVAPIFAAAGAIGPSGAVSSSTPVAPAETSTTQRGAGELVGRSGMRSRRMLVAGAALAIAGAATAGVLWWPRSTRAVPAPLPMGLELYSLIRPRPNDLRLWIKAENAALPVTSVRPAREAGGDIRLVALVQVNHMFLTYDDELDDRPRTENGVRAALDTLAAVGTPGSSAALVTFGNHARLRLPAGPFTRFSGDTLGPAAEYRDDIAADLVTGVQIALDVLSDGDSSERRALVIIGDGSSLHGAADHLSLEKIATELAESRTTVYYILDPRKWTDSDEWQLVKKLTPRVYAATGGLATAAAEVAADLGRWYFVDFLVPSHLRDRELDVELSLRGQQLGTFDLHTEADEPRLRVER